MAARADPARDHALAPLPQAALDDGQRLACLRLARSENVGPVTFRDLINHFGGAAKALEALPELSRRGGRRTIRICRASDAEAELEAATRLGARVVFTIEPGYPALLAQVEVPPPLIFTKGDLSIFSRHSVAIVGSREASAGGMAMARSLATSLGQAGFVIVSGLARGIDQAAHQAALATGTIAVLAGGIDVVYPPESTALQAAIGERGCLVAESPLGFQPRGRDFPRRNRIVSGLSRGVLVVEAAQRSGSSITARFALEQGREVFAVPGHPLDPRHAGTNRLLKEGATLVTEAGDVISVLEPQLARPMSPLVDARVLTQEPAISPDGLDAPDRDRVISALGLSPVGLDEIARSTGLPIRVVQVAIVELDLAGRIERHRANLVSLRPA